MLHVHPSRIYMSGTVPQGLRGRVKGAGFLLPHTQLGKYFAIRLFQIHKISARRSLFVLPRKSQIVSFPVNSNFPARCAHLEHRAPPGVWGARARVCRSSEGSPGPAAASRGGGLGVPGARVRGPGSRRPGAHPQSGPGVRGGGGARTGAAGGRAGRGREPRRWPLPPALRFPPARPRRRPSARRLPRPSPRFPRASLPRSPQPRGARKMAAAAGDGGGERGAGLGGAAGPGPGPGAGRAAGAHEDARGPAPAALHPEEVAARLQRMRRELSNRRKILVKNLPQDSSCQVRGPGAGRRGTPPRGASVQRAGAEGSRQS